MKKLLLSLMVLATLASCGKDNKVSSAPGVGTNAITIPDQSGIALGAKIDAYTTTFGTGVIYSGYYQYSWNQLVLNGTPLYYKYTKATTGASSGSGYTCETKLKIFQVCKYSQVGSGMTNLVLSRNIYNASVDVNSKIAELKGLINSQNTGVAIQVQGTAHLLTLTDGRQIIIDTQYPLQANPIGIRDTAGVMEYLINITTSAN